jgi:HD-GYP domain-containing protein (c-di-GMP phosphodiesterase class II)
MEAINLARQLTELRDPFTAGHEKHVGDLAKAIAAQMGFDEVYQKGVMIAGYLHDTGKIIVPIEILCKPGNLSLEEFNLVKNHVQAGYNLLKDITYPWPIAEAVLGHHERLDGSGYPNGLKGDQISLESRILTVADIVDAMTSLRPYRAGLGIEKALAEIEHGRGTLYDGAVVDACLKLFRETGYKLPTSLT